MLSARVHRVRLRVAHDAQLPRARKLLEDALSQCDSSLASGRLLIVRSLDVGSIRSGAAPADVSSRIENDVRRLQRTAVRGEDSAAADAPMVYFDSALSASVALALRLGRGQAAREWFWPLAVPQYRQGMDRGAALRAVLFGALENDPPPLSAAALSGALCEHRCLTPLVASLQRDDGALLLARCGWQGASDIGAAPAQDDPVAIAQLPPWSVTALREVSEDGDTHDDVKQWLCCALMVAAVPQRAADPQLRTKAQAYVAVLGRSRRTVKPAPLPAPSDGSVVVRAPHRPWPHTRAQVAQDAASRRCVSPRAAFEAFGVEKDVGRGEISADACDEARPQHARTVRLPPAALRLEDDRISENAGLLFLINAASRLGIERWLAENAGWADWGMVPRLFAALAVRLDIRAADPIVEALPQDSGVPAGPSHFELPDSWEALAGTSRIQQRCTANGDARVLCALSGRLPLAGIRGSAAATDLAARFDDAPALARPYRGALEDALVDAWANALRLWCKAAAGVGLLAVVRRPGRVFCSATHVRVSFDLQSVDIRLRRVGLDFDPGWVPWFGRVVNFSYGAPDGDE